MQQDCRAQAWQKSILPPEFTFAGSFVLGRMLSELCIMKEAIKVIIKTAAIKNFFTLKQHRSVTDPNQAQHQL